MTEAKNLGVHIAFLRSQCAGNADVISALDLIGLAMRMGDDASADLGVVSLLVYVPILYMEDAGLIAAAVLNARRHTPEVVASRMAWLREKERHQSWAIAREDFIEGEVSKVLDSLPEDATEYHRAAYYPAVIRMRAAEKWDKENPYSSWGVGHNQHLSDERGTL